MYSSISPLHILREALTPTLVSIGLIKYNFQTYWIKVFLLRSTITNRLRLIRDSWFFKNRLFSLIFFIFDNGNAYTHVHAHHEL
jgi:hypothetical protein